MFRCHPLPSYLLLATVILATRGHGANLCHQDQSAALLRLKAGFHFNTRSPNCPWFSSQLRNLSSWKVDTNCCTWEGVTCDGTAGYVTSLDLSRLCTSGNLSSSDIFKLTSLRFLSLPWNNFDESPWPSPGFELLTDLEYLDLSYSGLSGALPVEKGQLSNLVALDLSGLDLKYLNLQTLIDSLGSLQQLHLDYVNISVSPTDLGHVSSTNTTSSLKELSMGPCTIIGGHFDSVLTNTLARSKLPNLVSLVLDGLDMKYMSLETLIDNLGSLQKMYLHDVNILVSPVDLTHAPARNITSGLKELSMEWCTITGGRFDTVLTKLPHLTNLFMQATSGVDFTNLSIDALINNLGNLEKLYLVSVNISVSPIRSAHACFTNNTTRALQELSVQGGTITGGSFDTILTKFPFISMLTLDSTKFSNPASIPAHFPANSSLEVLSLLGCALTGTFPSWIFRIKSLRAMDISGNDNLYGEFPKFIQGSALKVLILRVTMFSGKIPESIGNLRNLTRLDLSYCQFHGPIPPFAQWPMIYSVDLSVNYLTGSLPSDGYHTLGNLTKVDLSYNWIGGMIPASLFSHPSLEYLDLSQNNFTGKFLLYPTISSSLRSIDVSFNKLQGPISESLLELVGIPWLDLSSNNFTGTVDLSFLKNYKELDHLSISHNQLSVVEDGNHSYGEYPIIRGLGLASCNLSYVPMFLMHQKSITYLDLSYNNIGGHVPDWIWETGEPFQFSLNLSHNLFTSVTNLSNRSVSELDLSSNKFEGALPLPPLGIYQLDYSNNRFNSSIMPKFWSCVSSADSLSLANNSLVGEISHLICNATDIEVLDLSFNSFNGVIPPCLLKHNKRLFLLNLRGNNFHGSFPQDINKECALQKLDLNGNKLEGKLPLCMINCRMLQVIDLGNNLIVDTFPKWLGDLPLLKVLVLNSNRFHGPIEHYGMNKEKYPFFAELQILDLSSNFLNGSIPTQFLKEFKAMMVVSSGDPDLYVGIIETPPSSSLNDGRYYRDWVTVMLKGQETTLVQILTTFVYLDLSNNNFEGIIPNNIGDLKLLKQLNLSRNSFTGGIPPRIANLLQLESLDLSYNQFSGEIPPAMAQMSFLGTLNLSYNHLSGPIPQSSQFLTFPDSFLGNDGLCGKPLTRLCDTNHTPSATATPGSSKELNWEFLSVEVGIISGLAVVVVTTLLWGNGRRWVYWHVDKFWLLVLHPWICRRLR
ncbi:unnamed protein product [Urochloa decumbens]|uniref:Leucine-rich repeat-containing N-terminal plant-type domain-containing protein n=1 Tax=Urochloa decumbens TaxID=240449 RepID=A0ABC9BRU7_9POAL